MLDMATIARDHYDAVYRFCYRRVGVEWAADAAQETFLTAQKALGKFRFESSVRTWLLGIANNECRRVYRQRRLKEPELELLDDVPGAADPTENVISRQLLAAALERLSPEHRAVVILREIDGLTYEESAAVLGIPSGTVKSRLHHAFLNLRAMLTESGTSAASEEGR